MHRDDSISINQCPRKCYTNRRILLKKLTNRIVVSPVITASPTLFVVATAEALVRAARTEHKKGVVSKTTSPVFRTQDLSHTHHLFLTFKPIGLVRCKLARMNKRRGEHVARYLSHYEIAAYNMQGAASCGLELACSVRGWLVGWNVGVG